MADGIEACVTIAVGAPALSVFVGGHVILLGRKVAEAAHGFCSATPSWYADYIPPSLRLCTELARESFVAGSEDAELLIPGSYSGTGTAIPDTAHISIGAAKLNGNLVTDSTSTLACNPVGSYSRADTATFSEWESSDGSGQDILPIPVFTGTCSASASGTGCLVGSDAATSVPNLHVSTGVMYASDFHGGGVHPVSADLDGQPAVIGILSASISASTSSSTVASSRRVLEQAPP